MLMAKSFMHMNYLGEVMAKTELRNKYYRNIF